MATFRLPVVGSTDLQDITTLTEIYQVRKSRVDETEGYDLCDINNDDETGIFFSLQPSKTLF